MVSLCRVIVILLFLGLVVFQGISEQTVSAQPTSFDGDIRITRYPGNSTCFKIETADGMTIVTEFCSYSTGAVN